MKLKNVPTRMKKDYTWPGVYKPFKHQEETSEFLSKNKRAYCLSEAGTGKTSGVIWAADYLMNQNKVNRMLVVCPLSIMQAAWQSDFFKTAMYGSISTWYPRKTQKDIS